MRQKQKKPLAVFDIDGTIFRSSLLTELNWRLIKAGIFPKKVIKEIDQPYFAWINRKGSYEKYINKVVASFEIYLKGKQVAEVRKVAKGVILDQKDRVYVYTRELLEDLKKTHHLLAISGSPQVILNEFQKHWGFDYVLGTEYEISKGKYSGQIKSIPVHNKKETLTNFVQTHGYSFKSSIGVGDTESDVGFLSLVERPICFNPNKNLYTAAKQQGWKIVIERKDVIVEL